MTFTCVETGLPPQTIIRLHSASSRGLGPIGPPGPQSSYFGQALYKFLLLFLNIAFSDEVSGYHYVVLFPLSQQINMARLSHFHMLQLLS